VNLFLHTYIGRQEKSKVVLTLLSARLGLKGRGSPVKYLLGVRLLGNLLLGAGFLALLGHMVCLFGVVCAHLTVHCILLKGEELAVGARDAAVLQDDDLAAHAPDPLREVGEVARVRRSL
jgi:hypothetical protein